MITAITFIVVLLFANFIHCANNKLVVDNAKEFIEVRLVRGYVSFFLVPLGMLGALYGLACAASLFVGLSVALNDVSTGCVMGFLMGLIACFCSFAKDAGSLAISTVSGRPRRYAGNFTVATSVLFFTCFYGSVGALFFGSTSRWCVFH